MGSTYMNVTLVGTSLDAVRAVAPRPAYALVDGDAIVLYARSDEEGELTGASLSAALGCVAVTVGVFDDDVMLVQVDDRGETVLHGAVPDPGEFFGIDPEELADLDPEMLADMGVDASPSSGAPDPALLVEVLGRGDVGAVAAALATDFVFSSERHAALVAAVGLPDVAVGWGYRYLASDDGDHRPNAVAL